MSKEKQRKTGSDQKNEIANIARHQIGIPIKNAQPESQRVINVNRKDTSWKFKDSNTDDNKKSKKLRNQKKPKNMILTSC